MSDWQPIETAPTIGTPVLLFARWVGATASVRIVGHYVPTLGWIALSFGNQEIAQLIPTYWMPLPEMPK